MTPSPAPITSPASAAPFTNLSGPRRWLSRFGVLAFVFFLFKGLLWLVVPAALIAMNREGPTTTATMEANP